jgi:hypothetical protein
VLGAPFALLTLLFATQVDVRSATNCPSARDVFDHLTPLLPGTPDATQREERDLAEVVLLGISPDGTSDLLLRLSDAAQVPIGERRVSLRGSCSDMAEFVAAIFAAWKTDPQTRVVEPTTPIAARAKEPGSVAQQPASPVSPGRLDLSLGASAGAAFVGGMALSGSLELRAGTMTSAWHVRLACTGETDRQLDLASGQVDWQHSQVSLGLAWQRLARSWVLALDLGPVAGWASVSGRDFASSREARSFEYGATAGLRTGRGLGRWAIWLEARPTVWATSKQARVTTPDGTETRDLPRAEIVVGLGVSTRLRPSFR